MKFLVFTTDVPPIAGFPTSGTALRTYNLGLGLKDLGHEVIFSAPKDALENFSKQHPEHNTPDFKELLSIGFDSTNQNHIISLINPDVIICGHWPAWTLGRKPAQPLIIDLAGPHLLERHFQGDNDPQGAILSKLNVLACADYFIVSGQKQKLYFLSFMLRAKISNPEERICIVPMPLPEIKNINDNLENDSPNFIFGGVFLPWQNQLANQLNIRKKGNLNLIGGPHPHYKIDSGNYEELFKNLSTNKYVNIKPLLPYDQFLSEMKGKDVALDLMSWNLERELAITIRSCTYLWSGIPIIYNNFADLSALIKSYNAGWCINDSNSDEFDSAIEEIYSSPQILKQKKEGALRLAKDHFDRKKNAADILKLLKTPSIPLSEEIDISMDVAENCDLFLKNGISLSQRFTSRIDGLKEIRMLFGTHGKDCSEGLKISLNEISTNSASLIHEDVIENSKISDNNWLSLKIEPQISSAGKEYEITISHLNEVKDSVLSPWTISSSPYPLSGLYSMSQNSGRKKIGNQALCIKTICAR
jgi:hypothetical protein